jgi:hypothetical protein
MKKTERLSRIIARGEHSNHSHVVVGDAVVRNEKGEIVIEVGQEGAVLRHLLETDWLAGKETWTKEHHDIKIEPGTYKYIPQLEFDPYDEEIKRVKD